MEAIPIIIKIENVNVKVDRIKSKNLKENDIIIILMDYFMIYKNLIIFDNNI